MARTPRFNPELNAQEQIKQALLGAVKGETNENPVSLVDFCESTLSFSLHEWQRNYLCPLLERFRVENGLRIVLHAPPQTGKSIVVSQRAPAWLIGCNPRVRNGLASYNQDHSIKFGAVIRDLMQEESYERLFPNSGCRINTQGSAAISAQIFSTRARVAMKDAQPSFVALGMASGFVGRGLDNLFIDDPYASADEARSPAINDRTWRWWEDTASPRLSSESNVLVVYHRYSMDDLGARLLAQGGWENVRFPMIADDNPDGDDPTNPSMRIKGQLLSPIRTLGWVEQQREKAPGTFFAQFQGTPLLGDATVFNVAKLRKVPMSELPKVLSVVRSWDFAASDGKGDWTVGVKFGIDFNNNNTCYILDVTRTRKATSERDELILETALTDGYEVPICIPQDPAAAGLSVIDYLTKKLAGFIVNAESVSGDKVLKATPLAGQLNIGNVLLVEGSWNKDFEDEFRSFPLGKHDDQVDSTAQAFNHLIRFPRTTISINSQREILNVQAAGTQTMGTRKIVDENGITSVLPFRNRNFSTRRFL